MHELIKKEIDRIKENTKNYVAKLKKIDERLLAYAERFSNSTEVNIWLSNVDGYNEFLEQLKEIQKIAKLEFSFYWIGGKNRVCVEYKESHGTCINFTIIGNEQEIINKLSNGKCKVIESKDLTIVCENKE